MPYLGQQPEGEKEHGFHGPAAGRLAECPAGRGPSCTSCFDRTRLSDSTSARAVGRVSDYTWPGRGLVLNDSTSARAGGPHVCVEGNGGWRAGGGAGGLSE